MLASYRKSVCTTRRWHDVFSRSYIPVASYCIVRLQVLVPKDVDLMGKLVEVEVIETGKHFMKSKLIEATAIVEPGLVKPLEKGEVSGRPKQLPKESPVSVDTIIRKSLLRCIIYESLSNRYPFLIFLFHLNQIFLKKYSFKWLNVLTLKRKKSS